MIRMIILSLVGMAAALFLAVGLLVWLVLLICGRKRFIKTMKWTAISFVFFVPLLVFLILPLLSARLIAHSGTRPMDLRLEIDPSTYGCTFQDVEFDSRDGYRLSGWWMAGEPGQPAFVLTHGLFRDRKEVVQRACRLNQLGYPALAFDQRRHGASEGGTVSLGYQERKDVLGAYDWVRQRSDGGVVLLGVSMGASAVLQALPELGDDVRLVVADSPFQSLQETVSRHVGLFLGLPSFPFSEVFSWALAAQNDYSPRDFDTLKAVRADESIPVLLIYGESDERMPAETAEAVFDAVPEQLARLVFFPNAGHGHAWDADPERYLNVIQESLAPSQPPAPANADPRSQ